MTSPEAWCLCCSGSGEAEETRYVLTSGEEPKVVKTGATKKCGGCDGKKISVRAKKWRDEHAQPAQA